MGFNEALLAYRFPAEIIYTLIVVVSCSIVAYKANAFYRLSHHEGLRHFRNTFVYFGLAYLVRYVEYVVLGDVASWMHIPFGFLMSIAGFSLIRSMEWKCVSRPWWLLTYAIAVLIPVLDLIVGIPYFLFLSQIALFTYGVILAKQRYQPNARGVRQVHLIVMVLFLLGWIVNFIGQMLYNTYPVIVLYVYVITSAIFVLFVFAIMRVHRGKA